MRRIISLVCILTLALGFCAGARAEGLRKNCVAELYSAEGVYTDSLGNVENYSYHVPQLCADTEDAREINREIEERFGERVKKQFESMDGGYSLWMWECTWHAYWQDSRLFLMVSAEMEADSVDYAAWGYDFETGHRVDNAMILDSLGVSEDEYMKNLREKVAQMFESKYSFLTKKQWEQAGCDKLLEDTLDWLDPEQPMYIDGSGQIVTIVKIASVAGARWYYHLATPFAYG